MAGLRKSLRNLPRKNQAAWLVSKCLQPGSRCRLAARATPQLRKQRSTRPRGKSLIFATAHSRVDGATSLWCNGGRVEGRGRGEGVRGLPCTRLCTVEGWPHRGTGWGNFRLGDRWDRPSLINYMHLLHPECLGRIQLLAAPCAQLWCFSGTPCDSDS